MRAYVVFAISALLLSGCEAPSDPTPQAPPDPLEDAIARYRLPEPVARVMRLLPSLPADASYDAVKAHLGLVRQPVAGMALLEIEWLEFDLVPGYWLGLSYNIFTDRVASVSIKILQAPGNPHSDYYWVSPHWTPNGMRYN